MPMLKAIYVTHAHGDHFFGIKVLQDRFPSAKALATPAVVAKMKLRITPEKLHGRWRKLFPNQIPDVISIADPFQSDEPRSSPFAENSCRWLQRPRIGGPIV